jgi:sec-independent protein translocase protein TatA
MRLARGRAKGRFIMTVGLLAQMFGPDGLIVLVVLVVVLLFGGAQLPKLARGFGSASHEFKKGLSDGEDPTVATPDESTSSAHTA